MLKVKAVLVVIIRVVRGIEGSSAFGPHSRLSRREFIGIVMGLVTFVPVIGAVDKIASAQERQADYYATSTLLLPHQYPGSYEDYATKKLVPEFIYLMEHISKKSIRRIDLPNDAQQILEHLQSLPVNTGLPALEKIALESNLYLSYGSGVAFYTNRYGEKYDSFKPLTNYMSDESLEELAGQITASSDPAIAIKIGLDLAGGRIAVIQAS